MSKKLVIIGGGAAGPSAAAEARRGDPSLKVSILEKGAFVSYSA
ncbi:MAG TPA: NAD(P)-binding protein [Smithellaceae bacterium]|nr:NAD(P)-binding protein [Smithellaceae bacterium]HRS88785.1 NAD(P)-binding protein [Smithellaceae bacterium]HRV25778.1 NAD(P)-binding protein [Smithellaceae bacterium]